MNSGSSERDEFAHGVFSPISLEDSVSSFTPSAPSFPSLRKHAPFRPERRVGPALALAQHACHRDAVISVLIKAICCGDSINLPRCYLPMSVTDGRGTCLESRFNFECRRKRKRKRTRWGKRDHFKQQLLSLCFVTRMLATETPLTAEQTCNVPTAVLGLRYRAAPGPGKELHRHIE
ncbi:hypothetical protein AAFF_G00007650 [Aldrovandia affinis]|uniref:Uncharacterized protein n=1 Tax=Aldrovandia affinis TaxID=143900 RepID=A0AAD7T636_9TELE|nr:hypothetical protein AAFF_G00007650 [Aldrovandia affinis]